MPASLGNGNYDKLPPGLRELFSIYDLISEVDGEALLESSKVELYKPDKRFLTVGVDFDAVILAVKILEEPIYVFDGSELTAEEWSPAYPSIFHWILAKNYLLYGI